MATITTRIEQARGCGYRKPGGIYLVADGIGSICCRLPHELTVCPCCGEGIKQSRGFTWVTGAIFGERKDEQHKQQLCTDCPLNDTNKKFGLMWVGEKYYKTAIHFTREANAMGVSKRIAQVPTDLIVGTTWILLAHPKAVMKIEDDKIVHTQGIFQAFRPTRIEYIITGEESEDELNRLEKRGFTLIKVQRDIDQQMNIPNQ